ncbi:MAG TPA: hypothetical protein PKC43_12145 [Phycisphaerales bacterium]|nr:hypothetical protein [Phycisphaerales bacterium]HMP38183.1 hypothetical protein [Phycisphaerales bacterium]
MATSVAVGSPALPPPSHSIFLLPRFFELLESYVALDAEKRVPFAAWVVMNGITDPRMVAGMVALHEWYWEWYWRVHRGDDGGSEL